MQKTLVGLKDLRENINTYIARIEKGDSITVIRRSKPIFKISPVDHDDDKLWEPVIDFTKIQTGGVEINELLSKL